MLKIVPLALTLLLASSLVQAGFSGTKVAYGGGFNNPQQYNIPYGSNFGSTYAAPLPVAPLSGYYPYNALTYAAPNFFKFRSSGGAFGCGPSLRSRPRFAFSAPIPPVYDAPLPDDFPSSDVNYSGFEEPNIVIKFGPPITTTTTSFSTSAAAAAAVHVRTPLKAATGW